MLKRDWGRVLKILHEEVEHLREEPISVGKSRNWGHSDGAAEGARALEDAVRMGRLGLESRLGL